MRPTLLVMVLPIALGACIATTMKAQTTQSPQRQVALGSEAQMTLREVPPEMTRRFLPSYQAMQPSAKAWVEQQARLEAQKPAPDVAALEGAIRSRFQALKSTNGAAGTQYDVDTLAFIVMMQATNDMDQDLKAIMAQVKALTAAKQQLRDLLSKINTEVAAAPTISGNTPCRTPFCRSLPSKLSELSATTAGLQHPVRLDAPAGLSYVKLRGLQGQLKESLDSVNEMSEMTSLRLQMTMDRRSKFIETLSNIMKKTSDTQSSIVRNLK